MVEDDWVAEQVERERLVEDAGEHDAAPRVVLEHDQVLEAVARHVRHAHTAPVVPVAELRQREHVAGHQITATVSGQEHDVVQAEHDRVEEAAAAELAQQQHGGALAAQHVAEAVTLERGVDARRLEPVLGVAQVHREGVRVEVHQYQVHQAILVQVGELRRSVGARRVVDGQAPERARAVVEHGAEAGGPAVVVVEQDAHVYRVVAVQVPRHEAGRLAHEAGHGLDRPGVGGALQRHPRAVGGACGAIGPVGIAVVTGLDPVLHDAVAAERERARGGARVRVHLVLVVAGLHALLNDAVATTRGQARGGAGVGVDQVPVVADLTRIELAIRAGADLGLRSQADVGGTRGQEREQDESHPELHRASHQASGGSEGAVHNLRGPALRGVQHLGTHGAAAGLARAPERSQPGRRHTAHQVRPGQGTPMSASVPPRAPSAASTEVITRVTSAPPRQWPKVAGSVSARSVSRWRARGSRSDAKRPPDATMSRPAARSTSVADAGE